MKVALLILAVLIALLGVWIRDQIIQTKADINYYFLRPSNIEGLSFSLDIEDSDWNAHECILNALIGNLVKYTATGKIEPYLAEQFSVSTDGKIWSYKLRPNLVCEDGSPINAKSFAESLHRQIYEYSKKSAPIDFENLIGYSSFVSGKTKNIDGLSYNDDEIIFRFTKRPEDLNEILRMPYFGFWCRENLEKKLWKNEKKFISSGPYKLSKDATEKTIIIEKRSDWFSVLPDSINKFIFKYNSSELNNLSMVSSIYEGSTNMELPQNIQEKLIYIQGLPTLAMNLILSPHKSGFFAQIENRRSFLNHLINKQTEISNLLFNDKYFYNSAISNISYMPSLVDLKKIKPTILTIGTMNKQNPRTEALLSFLKNAFIDTNIKFDIKYQEGDINKWREKLLSNNEFDIRSAGVANGAQIRNFIVKMIFCTKLGVTYPDPSGRICELVKQQEGVSGPISKDYVERFNQILYEDASVVTLSHSSPMWLLTKDLDESYFSPTVEHPLFETIRFK